MKNKCSIETCVKERYCKGFCRNHYASLLRHGDPLQAERNVAARELRIYLNKQENDKKIKREINKGKICKCNDCLIPAKTKGYCQKHYERLRRNGTLKPKKIPSEIEVDKCIVINCTAKPKAHGICANHLANIRELKTPFKPKIVKLCGVKKCENLHMGNGMCAKHYIQWKAVVRDYKLSKYVELRGWEDDGVWKR